RLETVDARDALADRFLARPAHELRETRTRLVALALGAANLRVEAVGILLAERVARFDRVAFANVQVRDRLRIRRRELDAIALERAHDRQLVVTAASRDQHAGDCEAARHAFASAATISKSCVISTPPRSSMIDAEQYFS